MSVVFLALAVGWVSNIVKLAGMDLTPFTGEALVRIIGIVVGPVGGVYGYF